METSVVMSLFTTLAQVSFTVTGLLAIAIAGDNKIREYWFKHQSRSFYVQISFLLLLLPGFVSIGSLITISSKTNIPTWPYAGMIFGLIYSSLAIGFFFRKKNLADPGEFRRLEHKFFKVIPDMGIYGLALIFLSLFGLSAYYSATRINFDQIQIGFGVLLVFSVLSSTATSIILLRAYELPMNVREETNIIAFPDPSVGNNRKADSDIYIITALLIAVISFVIGLFVNQRSK